MKPSGPGLLFAGRFLITVSISVLVMGLFMNFLTGSLDYKCAAQLNRPLKPFNNKCLKVMPYPVFPLFVATLVSDI